MNIMFSPKVLLDPRRLMSTFNTQFLDSIAPRWFDDGAFADEGFNDATINCSLSDT
jgi:hypothetical protein